MANGKKYPRKPKQIKPNKHPTMKHIKYILFMLLATALGACMSSERLEPAMPTQPEEAPSIVRFGAAVSQEKSEDSGQKGYFNDTDEIRICPTVSYSTPDFSDGGKAHIYQYTGEKDDEENPEFPYLFTPRDENGGFNWLTLFPTSVYYVFEAMHFPGKHYLDTVPSRQDLAGNFEKADILIAHHRQPIGERGQNVKLNFHHAFAMVEVTVVLPENTVPYEGVFPPDALKAVYMSEMQTRYHVEYAEVISNDSLRSVTGTGDERKNVYMRRIPTPETGKAAANTQTYVFKGIVPAQDFLYDRQDFIFFEVMKHDNSGKPTLYRLKKPEDGGVTLKASKILSITLNIKENSQSATIVRSELKPWGQSETNMWAGKEPKNN